MNRLSKNFLYNIIYQIFIYIVPLIVTPYISKILGPDNIGIYSYCYSIVYYFMLITLLGINNYGSRNIARLCTDRVALSKEFCSIYYLQLLIGLCMLLVYNVLITTMFRSYHRIFVIQNLFLFSAILDINWFYFGLQKFKLTIGRNIIIKIFSVCMVFLFVKRKNDLWIYTLIMSTGTLASQLYLWLFIKKYVDFRKVKIKEITTHLKPCLVLFVPVIAYSLYKVMDKTMLGAISGTRQLGYYENAEKIINIPSSLVAALATVTLPVMAQKAGKKEGYLESIYENFRLSFILVVPMVFGIMAVSRDFSVIFFGTEFAKCSDILLLLAPTILFDSISGVIRTCILIPQNMEKIYLISTVTGGIINLAVNRCLIPSMGCIGASIGTIVAVSIVTIIQLFFVRKIITIKKIICIMMPFLIKSLIMLIIVIFLGIIISGIKLRLFLQIAVGIMSYMLMNYNYWRDTFRSI